MCMCCVLSVEREAVWGGNYAEREAGGGIFTCTSV